MKEQLIQNLAHTIHQQDEIVDKELHEKNSIKINENPLNFNEISFGVMKIR